MTTRLQTTVHRTIEWYVALLGKQVTVDGHFEYLVTAVMWRCDYPQVEVAYFDDAKPNSAWVEGWRIDLK